MRVLALIPARGGSRGLPGKNLRMLGGRSLVGWAIAAAKLQPGEHELHVIVSSDDPQILAHAKLNGVTALARPADLATDEAATDPVILHALAHVTAGGWRPDVVALLQPTTPVRPDGLLQDALDRLLATGADCLATATLLHHVWRRSSSGPGWTCETPRVRRQDFQPHDERVHEDGALFLTRTELLEQTGHRLGGYVEMMVIPYAPDIDTETDLRLAQTLQRSRSCEVMSA
jgi:N-acylneuraminate cytidylyltransferase